MQNKYQKNENRNNKNDEGLDEIIKYLKSFPKPMFCAINMPKYQKMLQTTSKLQEILCKESNEVTIEVKIIKEFNMGAITIKAFSLEILSPDRFADVIKEADNIEIYTHTDGSIEFNLTFQKVLISI